MLPEARAKRVFHTAACDTRWRPVDLVCECDGVEIVSRCKLHTSRKSAAMCISEAFSHEMLRRAGFTMAEPMAVSIDKSFAADLALQFEVSDGIVPGWHWGTRLLQKGTLEIELDETIVDSLKDQSQLFRLFLMDVVLANPDRSTSGNVLWKSLDSEPSFTMIPIDQSDCFDHLEALLQSNWECGTVAQLVPGLGKIVLDSPGNFLEQEFSVVAGLRTSVEDCAAIPKQQWYDAAGVEPSEVVRFIHDRIDNLDCLAKRTHWAKMDAAVEGGHVLKFSS